MSAERAEQEFERHSREFQRFAGRGKRFLMLVRARIHIGVHTRLGIQRVIAFVGNNGFRVLGAVVVLGMFFGWLVRVSTSMVAKFASAGVLLALVVLFMALMLKEYFLSPQFRRLRNRVERRLLVPVAHRVFVARVNGMLWEAINREQGPGSSTSVSSIQEAGNQEAPQPS
jgi:hypothetical protein